MGAPFNAKVEVRDTYVYGGRGGRVSQNDTEMIFNDAPAEGFRQTSTWDNLGNLASQSYPDCFTGSCAALDAPRTVSFTYSYGRLATVPGFTGSATTTTGTPVNQITYHPSGLVYQVPHANQMLYTAAKDLWGRAMPSWFQGSRGSTIYWNTGTHIFDGAGNLEGTGELSVIYDSLSRVTQMTMAGTTQSYSYDVYGNIQSITTGGSAVGTPTSSATNHLSSGSYDAAGSLASWSGNTYEHDAFGQLQRYVAGTQDWRYIYTADDERFWSYRVSDGTSYASLWSLRGFDGQVLRRYEAHLSWGNYEDYVYREGQLLAAAHTPVAPAPKTGMWHFHLDHLGTPRMVTNQNGGSIGFHRYYPFGQEETALQEGDVRKFTGHERDLASLAGTADDLDYMHARHHSPLLGRFISTDSIAGVVSRPQTWNRYAYVIGNPLKWVDPTGNYFAFAPGLSNGEQRFLRRALTEVARRPSGREVFQRLAADPRAVILKVGSLNSDQRIRNARGGAGGTLTFGLNTFRNPANQSTSVTLDQKAIQEFARRSSGTADPRGITTMAHELFHADKALNATYAEWAAGDKPTNDTGPAQRFGESTYRQSPDLSFDNAASIVIAGFFFHPFLGSTWNLIEPFLAGTVCLEGVCSAPNMHLTRY